MCTNPQNHPSEFSEDQDDKRRLQSTLAVGGPAQKMTFFQVVQKSFSSVPIYCSRCKYDSLDFFFKNIAWNLSVECVKHENVGSGRFSSRFLPGF